MCGILCTIDGNLVLSRGDTLIACDAIVAAFAADDVIGVDDGFCVEDVVDGDSCDDGAKGAKGAKGAGGAGIRYDRCDRCIDAGDVVDNCC